MSGGIRSRWRRTAPGLPALALGLLVAACTLPAEDAPRTLTPSQAPFGVLEQPEVRRPTGRGTQRLFLVRDGRLVPVGRRAAVVSPELALQDLVAGPTPEEQRRGLTTALPGGLGVPALRFEDGVAVVDLDVELPEAGRSDQVLALAQVVATLETSPRVRGVRFVRDDVPVEVPRGDGSVTDEPVTLQDYDELLASAPPRGAAPSQEPGPAPPARTSSAGR